MVLSISTSPAERLLSAAAALFAEEGIRAVGIDRLISEAGVARASLYVAFGSKDRLIAEYLRRQHETDRRTWQAAARGAGADPLDRMMTFFDCAARSAKKRRYAGCLYLNAAAEFPDRTHPVWPAIDEHRTWMRAELTGLLTEAGIVEAAGLAAAIQLLYDGGLSGSKFAHSVEPVTRAATLARALIQESRPRHV